jgi:hypothetical protein
VRDAQSGREISITSPANSPEIVFATTAGYCYLIERTGQPSLPFAAIDGQPAIRYRRLNSVQIGLPEN